MTRSEAKERAKEIWDDFKWWLALVVFPALAWGAKQYDASKLDERVFADYVHQQEALQIQREIRDSARQENVYRALRYNACLTRMKGRDEPCAHLTTP